MAERAVRPEGSWTIAWVSSSVSRAHVCATMCEATMINWMFAVRASGSGVYEVVGSLWVTRCGYSRYSADRGGEIEARVKLAWWK